MKEINAVQNSDRPKFAELVTALAESFRTEVTEGMLTGYWLGLKDLELQSIEGAVGRCLQECRFFPNPVEVREKCGVLPAEHQAELAWEALVKAIRHHGYNSNVEFEDPVIAIVVERMGGWPHLTGLASDELLKWTRKEFLAAYTSHHKQSGGVYGEPVTLFGAHPTVKVKHIEAPYLDGSKFRIGSGRADRIIDAVADYMEGKR